MNQLQIDDFGLKAPTGVDLNLKKNFLRLLQQKNLDPSNANFPNDFLIKHQLSYFFRCAACDLHRDTKPSVIAHLSLGTLLKEERWGPLKSF